MNILTWLSLVLEAAFFVLFYLKNPFIFVPILQKNNCFLPTVMLLYSRCVFYLYNERTVEK